MVPETASNTDAMSERIGLLGRLVAILTAVLVLAWPIFALVGYWSFGVAGLWSATAAGFVCWVATVAALVVAAVSCGPNAALFSLLGGMFLRLGLPLVFGMVAQDRSPTLAAGRILGMVLAYYLVALPTETWLSLKLVHRSSTQPVAKAA